MELALKIVHIILAVGVVAGVLLQSGKSAGMPGAIAGGAQTFFGKKKGLEERLARVTSAFAILFMISSIVLAFVVGR